MKKIIFIISALFHPSLLAVLTLTYLHLYFESWNFFTQLIEIIFLFALPTIFIILLKQINYIHSITLKSRSERNLPLLISAVLAGILCTFELEYASLIFLWTKIISALLLALFLINFFSLKVSLHAAGASAMLILGIFFYHFTTEFKLFVFPFFAFMLIILIRYLSKEHSIREIIWGVFVGSLIPAILLLFSFNK